MLGVVSIKLHFISFYYFSITFRCIAFDYFAFILSTIFLANTILYHLIDLIYYALLRKSLHVPTKHITDLYTMRLKWKWKFNLFLV